MRFKYILFIVFVLSCVSLNAQTGSPYERKPIYIENNTIYTGESSSTFISFKVPYNNLVFIKDDSGYKSGIIFTVEIYSPKDEKLIRRESTTLHLHTDTYEDTENPDIFLNGILSTNLDAGNYRIHPLVDLENTNRSIKLREFDIVVPEQNADSVKAIIVSKDQLLCDEFEYFLVNHENKVPFGDNNSALFFSFPELISKSPKITVFNKGEIEYQPNAELFNNSSLTFNKCGTTIGLGIAESSSNTTLLKITEGLSHLREGRYNIEFEFDGKVVSSEFFVEWINKPLSLSRPRLAIELLNIAYGEEAARDLLRKDEEEYYDELVKFWKKYDPVEETEFNELMNEYYQRADFSIRNFSSLDKRNGAETDRGKTFIKFGYPDSIERGSNEKNKITEIWYYGEMGKTFIFVDETGLGNFIQK
ncbi:MAG: hypothetical protein SCALA702_27440 [Melioribacteraceae bacterium]|nr:MAG: hypothetical protein SCALA702_27440 [Melioribacteraceae bacterium]